MIHSQQTTACMYAYYSIFINIIYIGHISIYSLHYYETFSSVTCTVYNLVKCKPFSLKSGDRFSFNKIITIFSIVTLKFFLIVVVVAGNFSFLII
jgi:hypothetical protein